MTEEIEVSVDLGDRTVKAGLARVDRRRNVTTTSFTYDSSYLADPEAYEIDPGLPFDARGGVSTGLPGAFADCAPDRWGRRLITRRIRAAETGTPRSIGEIDFLLGVSDMTRQGALRFRRAGNTHFEDPDADVPRRVRLPELLRASEQVSGNDSDERLSEIKILLDAGTGTLGGARPKASVIGDDGRLCMAKFPHHDDDWDVMAWEKTALDLADRAGIQIPRSLLVQVSGASVLLLERFDRAGERRIGYISAMTLLRGEDGGRYDYLDLGADLAEVSSSADADLEDLWRRMAFSVAVHNTDDHMRNHGMLRSDAGWRMSPVFDVNPNPDVSQERATSIAGATSRGDEVEALFVSAGEFGIPDVRARQILAEIEQATASWREVASSNGVTTSEINRFEGAFDGLRAELAKSIVQPRSPLR